MFRHLMNALAIGALSLAIGPRAAAAEAPQTSALRVTYLVYSGRPNPTLTITDADTIRSIQSQLSGAATTGAGVESTDPPPILGYNGIRIEAIGPPAAQAVEYTVKGRFLRLQCAQAGANAKQSAVVAASTSTAAAQIEAQLAALGERRGVLDAPLLKSMRASSNR